MFRVEYDSTILSGKPKARHYFSSYDLEAVVNTYAAGQNSDSVSYHIFMLSSYGD